ncbi:MAG: hypothetical protein AMXMBFR13_47710 [Phycisphaerae bacterium]
MSRVKYIDRVRGSALTGDEGCPYEQWPARSEEHPFAVHPGGFKVFLPPSQLSSSDEYAAADPYTVVENLANPFHRRRFETISRMLNTAVGGQPSPAILDLGCGEGHMTAEFQKCVPGGEVSGLDYSVSAIAQATARYPGIDFIVADACSPPYADSYFDVVVCANLWEHVPDPLALLAIISRISKPGAWLIISTPSRYRYSNLIRALLGRPVQLMSGYHVTEYTVGQVSEQLRFGGFDVREVSSCPIRAQVKGHVQWISRRIVERVISSYIRAMGSHHSLEATVFYLACKGQHQ